MEQEQELKILTARVQEAAERSLRAGEPEWTDFLDPLQREQIQAVLSYVTGIRVQVFGGYTQAERKRLVVFPDYYIAESIETALSYLQITKNGGESELSHRDYLGALMGLGLKREKIGDLILVPDGCQVVVVPELADYLQTNLTQVGNQKVTVTVIEPEQLILPVVREKEIKATVASLRLDAVAAFGFGESRTKMAREIKSARVRVNWKPVLDPDHVVEPGDIISIRGRGRVCFRELTGRSKKGRQGILLVRQL